MMTLVGDARASTRARARVNFIRVDFMRMSTRTCARAACECRNTHSAWFRPISSSSTAIVVVNHHHEGDHVVGDRCHVGHNFSGRFKIYDTLWSVWKQ